MTRILITAFEPYGGHAANASWLCLMELTRMLPATPRITTRLYPVEFALVRQMLADDLTANYDFALHLGQAPGSALIRLEELAVNIGGDIGQSPADYRVLSDDGPVAYRVGLPLARWRHRLHEAGIPAEISYHAGTYLCNATLYWSLYLTSSLGLATQSAFIHLPLETSQVLAGSMSEPSLPASQTAQALRLILAELT